MSLAVFQRALSDLIASPQLCLLVRSDPERYLARYDLSPRERRRLETVVWQRGMSTSCTLYRINRITPLYNLLPLTCHLMGEALVAEAEQFWRDCGAGDAEFQPEVERFAHFLLQRLAAGELADPYLEEVLRFELAVNALHFLPRRQIQRQLAAQSNAAQGALRLHPLIRLVAFRHEPLPLLEALAERQPPPEDARPGDFWVILDATGESFALRLIDPADAALLARIDAGGGWPRDARDRLHDLRAAGLVVAA